MNLMEALPFEKWTLLRNSMRRDWPKYAYAGGTRGTCNHGMLPIPKRMMNSIEPLPFEKWISLRDSMKRDWPKYAHLYNFFNYAIKWRTKDAPVKVTIYCPNSNADAGICTDKRGDVKLVYLFAFEESKDILKAMLFKNDVIRWHDTFNFAAVHECIQDVLEDFLNTEAKGKGLQGYSKETFTCYLKSKEDCLAEIIEIPEECELKRIDERYIPLINSHWQNYRNESSMYYLSNLVRFNASYGLFLKKDNTLVAWILQCNRGCPAVLNTLVEHRRKGYGKIVTLALAKCIAEEDDADVTLFVDDCNGSGQRFFEFLGFTKISSIAWYNINKIV